MIEVKGLYKSYDKILVLSEINLKICPGEIICILGKNGSGKTTLFKCILGLTRYDKGEILFNGIRKSEIGIAISRDFLIPKLKVNEYLRLIFQLKNNALKLDDERLYNFLNIIDLESEKDKLIYNLSKGNKQKLLLISALITNPKLLILDEPFDGMDSTSITKSKILLEKFIENNGAVFMSTHRIEIIRDLDSYVVILDQNTLGEKIKWSHEAEKLYLN